MNPNDKIILPDSPEAATYRTDICAWVSRDGTFYGDGPRGEKVARYVGCTHVLCKRCGEATPKEHSLCDACTALYNAQRYAAMPRAKWDGETPLHSEVTEKFYYCLAEAEEDAAEMEEPQTLADLRLVICEPVHATPLETDYFSDDLPDDGDIPQQIADAIDAFNAAVAGVVLSWAPGKTALDLEDEK